MQRTVILGKDEQHTAEYRKLAPLGTVPVLKVRRRVVHT